MYVRDVMSIDPLTASPEQSLKDAARVMVESRVSGLPVIDEGRLVGIITEGDFLRAEADKERTYRPSLLEALLGHDRVEDVAARTVGEVMTRSLITVTPDELLGDAARMMATQRVKRLPVVDDDGFLVGIISRADVVNAFTKPDEVIEDEVREDLIRRLLFIDPDELGVAVREGVVTLSGEVDTRSEAALLAELTRRVTGVISVENDLRWRVDDTKPEQPYPIT